MINVLKYIWSSYIYIYYLLIDKLRKYFETFGPVQDAVVMKDPVTRRSRGFGFITFDDPLYVDIALEQEEHVIDARKVLNKNKIVIISYIFYILGWGKTSCS